MKQDKNGKKGYVLQVKIQNFRARKIMIMEKLEKEEEKGKKVWYLTQILEESYYAHLKSRKINVF